MPQPVGGVDSLTRRGLALRCKPLFRCPATDFRPRFRQTSTSSTLGVSMRALAHWKIAVPAAVSIFTAAGASNAQVATPGADEAAFRALYKELIEINTTRSVGNCTQAAEAMRKRLLAAGYAAEDMQILAPPEAPNDGALIAVLRGREKGAEPILLLAHIDVVEARREDWTRDPFKLVEEDGWFYARGASDDKAMAAVFTDSLIRYQAGRLQAAPRHQACADLRRGNGRRGPLRQRALAGEDAAGGTPRRFCPSTKALAASSTRTASPSP